MKTFLYFLALLQRPDITRSGLRVTGCASPVYKYLDIVSFDNLLNARTSDALNTKRQAPTNAIYSETHMKRNEFLQVRLVEQLIHITHVIHSPKEQNDQIHMESKTSYFDQLFML